jgi:hypothetical protein
MGKPSKSSSKTLNATQLRKLQRERRALARRMAKLDSKIGKLTDKRRAKRPTRAEFQQWLIDLSAGTENLPWPLPDDFSRADIYDDDYFDRLR